MAQGYDAALGDGILPPNMGEFRTGGRWCTELVVIAVHQPDSVALIPQQILQALQAFGTPLRWAITAVNVEDRTLAVEAVVIMPIPQSHELSR